MSRIPETPYRRLPAATPDTIPNSGPESWIFTILGLIMAAIPLALWMSWSTAIFYSLLILFAACFGAIWLLCHNPFRRRV